jgi:hypothetical protein
LVGDIGRLEERRGLLAMVKKQLRIAVSLLSHPNIMPLLEPIPERKRVLALEPIQHRKRGAERFPGHLQSFSRSPSKLHRSRRPRTGGNGQHKSVRRKPKAAPSGSLAVDSTETECPPILGFWEGNMDGDSNDLDIESLTMETETEDDTYQCFISLVNDNYLGFIDISSSLYMVQGFDLSKKESTVSIFILRTSDHSL